MPDGTEEIILSDGTVLSALIKCKNCPHYISQSWPFCPHCGLKKKTSST